MGIFTRLLNLYSLADSKNILLREFARYNVHAHKKAFTRIFPVVFFFILISFTVAAQTVVTAPTNGQDICSNSAVGGGAPAYTTLGNILISETANTGFNLSGSPLTLTLNVPSGWQFNTLSTPAYSLTGTDITSVTTASGGLTSSALTITVTGANANDLDAFTITGLQIQAVSTTSAGGNITSSSSTGFNGITTGTNFASLSLFTALAPTVNISASPAGAVCAGTSVTFTATPTNEGSSPSFQWQINGLNVQGETASTFTRSNLTNGSVVTVVLTSNASCIVNNPVTSSQLPMTVNDIPAAPTASNSGPACEGSTITLSTATVTGATYSWTGPGGFTSALQNPTIANAASGMAGVYSVTITLNGCTSIAGTTTVEVNPIPATPAPGNNGPTCAGSTINLTTPAVAGATYSWTGPGGFTSSVQNPTIANAASGMAGDYSVIVTVNGCASSPGTTSVVVNALPATPAASNAGAVCAGSSINLSTSAVAGATYSWSGPNNFTSTDQNPDIPTSTTAMAGVYSVIITLNGCTSLAGSTSVVVSAIPATPTASSNSPVCVGSPINLSTPAVAGATYSWTGPNNFVSAVQNPGIPNATTAMGGVYSVTITLNGCTSAAGSTTVVVNEVPARPIASSNSAVCAGGTITLSTAAVVGATYAWSGPNGFASTAQNPTIASATAIMAGTYSLTITVNGCSSPAGTTSVVVNPIPATPTAGSNGPVCAGGSINLNTPTVAGATYSWTGPNSFASALQNPVITNSTASMAGTYNVTVTVNGCTSAAGTTSVIVNPTLVPSVIISASSTAICSGAGTPVTFTATPTNGGSSPAYQWIRNGANILGATGATYTTTSLDNPSSISVVLTSNAPCASPITATSNAVAMTVYSSNVGNIGPNDLTGPRSICPVANNLTYSIPAVANAASYNWIFPAGWVINSGQGTRSVNVSATTGITGTVSQITVQAINPCEMKSRTYDINIGNFAGVNAGIDQTICSAGVINLSAVLQGNASTVTWTAPSGTFSNVNSLTPTYTPTITSGSVTLTVTTNAPVGSCPPVAGTDQVVITVNQPAAITTQPIATQTLCSGSTATFSVAATGTGLTYQWQKAGANIPGATSSTLTLNNITTGDAGNYAVVVSGTSPCTPVTSSAAVLVVNQAVAITTQPAATQTVCSGGPVSFSVAATGTGLTYQWRRGTTNIAGAISATFTINSATVADAGTDYNVVVTGTGPCTPLTSGNATLVVNEVVNITTQPVADQTLCSGSAATFSVTATGTGLSYQWRKGGANISGATSATLTLNNITTTDAGDYSVVVTGTGPCTPVTSATSALVVNQVVAITTQPVVSQTTCSGSAVSFTVVATGTGLSYQWRRGTTNIAGATAVTLTLNSVAPGDASSDYNVVITGTGPCSPVTSNNAALVVNEGVAIGAQPVAQTLCSGSTATFSVAATGTGLTYQWRKGGANISGATSNTLTLNNVVTADAGIYSVIVTGLGPCTPVTSADAALVVNQVVAITTQPAASQSVCSSFPVSFSVAATGTGLTYQWYRDGNLVNNISGVISGATSATLSISQAAVSHSGIYTVVVTGGAPCAPVTSANAQLTVNQSISITTQPVAQTNCEGPNISFTVAASGSIASYVWRRNGIPVSGSNYTGANSTILTITGVTTANAGNYDVVVSGTGASCSQVVSNLAPLTVNPVSVGGTIGGAAMVCSGTNSTVLTLSAHVGAVVRWESSLDNFATAGVPIANTTTSLTASNLTASTSYRAVVQSGVCSSANSAGATVSVTPAFVGGTVSGGATVCSGTSNTTLTLSGHSGAVIRWESSLNNFSSAGVAIANTTNALIISNIAATTSYRAVIGNGVCTPVNSGTATVTVDPVSAGGTIGGGTTVCAGTNSTILTLSGHTGSVVRWESSQDNFVTAGNPIANITNTFTASNISATTSYRAVVQSGSCISALSAISTVTVDPVSVGGTIAGAATVCSGTNSTILTLSGHVGAVVRWESSLDNFSTAGVPIVNTTTALTANNLTASTSYRAIVRNGVCSAANSLAATVSVTPVSAGGALSGGSTVCSGSNNTILTLSGNTGSVVRWESSTDNFSTAGQPISNTTNTLTISNITATTTYRAVIQNGTCPTVNSLTTTITVNPISVGGTIAGTTTVCSGTNSTVLTLSGYTGMVSRWESSLDNFASAGTAIANTTNTLTASNLSASTSYRAVVQSGVCTPAISSVTTIAVTPLPVGGTLSPALREICVGASGDLITLAGFSGTITRWESSINGGASWSPIANTTASYSYGTSVTVPTLFRAVIESGVCAPAYSSISLISALVRATPTVTASLTSICIGGSSVLTSTTGYQTAGISTTSGNFSNANPAGWRRDGQSTGSFLPADRDNTSQGPWGETNGPKTFSGITYDGGGGKFAIVDGFLNSVLETPVFTLLGQNSATFSFSQAYNLMPGATAIIEISTDGGNSYTSENLLAQYTGPATFGITGTTGQVQPVTISLADYIGLSDLRIRFRYIGSTGSSWAIDDIGVPAVLPITHTWTSSDPNSPPLGTTGTITVSPTITTTYTLTTFLDGCASGIASVTVTVNPLPTFTPAPATNGVVIACNSSIAQTVSLPYDSSNLPTPATYSITWTGAAFASFAPVVNTPIPASAVIIAIPAGTPAGTYTGMISVRNANGCSSVPVEFSIVINPLPTLGSVFSAALCNANSSTNLTVNLTGLLPNSTSTIIYQIGTSTAVTVSNVTADASGAGSFQAAVTALNDGQNLVIISISSTTAANAVSCPVLPTANNSMVLSVSSGYVWTGLGGNNLWSTLLNWRCGVPPNGSSVIIPQVANGNFPQMDVNFNSNNFELLGNATIELAGFTLELGTSVSSAIRNEGSIIGSRASTLNILGTLTQGLKFVQTTIGTTNALLNFTVNSPGRTATLANSLWVIGNVNPTAGIIASDGNLTMVSTASTSSNITQIISPADVSGVVNVQSYITGDGVTHSYRGFRSMSSPIDDSQIPTGGKKTYRQIKDYVVVTGPGGMANGFDQGGWAQPYAETISTYYEPAPATAPAFIAVPHIDQANIPGTGFFTFFRGSQGGSYDANSTKVNAPYAAPEPVTITYTGFINKSSVPVALTNSNNGDPANGYNLVGNPYPSTIDWRLVSKSAGVQNAVITVKQGGGQASYINGTANNGGSAFIQPGQGFLTITDSNGSITFNESDKSPSYPARLLSLPYQEVLSSSNEISFAPNRVKNVVQVLRLNLSDGKDTDETTIVFTGEAALKAGYEDVLYLLGGNITLGSMSSDGRYMAINAVPEIEKVPEIRLNINSKQSGDYKLRFSDLPDFKGYLVFLKDSLIPDQLKRVRVNEVYNIKIDKKNIQTYGSLRFTLVFKPVESKDPLALDSFAVRRQNDGIELTWVTTKTESGEQFEALHSSDGKSFSALSSLKSDGNNNFTFIDENPVAGANYYRIKRTDVNGITSLSEIKAILYSKGRQSLTVYPNPVADDFNLDVADRPEALIEMIIYDLHGRKVGGKQFQINENLRYNVSKLAPAVYIVEVKNIVNMRIIGRTSFIKVE